MDAAWSTVTWPVAPALSCNSSRACSGSARDRSGYQGRSGAGVGPDRRALDAGLARASGFPGMNDSSPARDAHAPRCHGQEGLYLFDGRPSSSVEGERRDWLALSRVAEVAGPTVDDAVEIARLLVKGAPSPFALSGRVFNFLNS